MTSRFSPGSMAYAKDGRAYTVEVVDGGTVYCTASNDIETEFPEAALFTAEEWAARSNGRRDISYTRLRQARAFAPSSDKIDRADAEKLIAKAERLSPSVLDFTAFQTARQILTENKDDDLVPGLSIVKSREIFDDTKPEIRARLLAALLGTKLDALLGAAKLGDNLLRAMLEKGLAAHATAFEDFLDRPRR